MKRYEMVKSHDEFNEIIQKGSRVSGKYIIVFRLQKDFEKPNFGIAVGKKCGNAVTRNKLKRQFRNIVDNNRFLFKNNNNYIIMIKKEANVGDYATLEKELQKLLKED